MTHLLVLALLVLTLWHVVSHTHLSLYQKGTGTVGQGSTGAVGMYVKIDRPAGIISFKHPRAPEVVLSDWSSDVR